MQIFFIVSVCVGLNLSYSDCAQRRQLIERLQNNLKEEYRAVFDFEVALFQTVSFQCRHPGNMPCMSGSMSTCDKKSRYRSSSLTKMAKR